MPPSSTTLSGYIDTKSGDDRTHNTSPFCFSNAPLSAALQASLELDGVFETGVCSLGAAR